MWGPLRDGPLTWKVMPLPVPAMSWGGEIRTAEHRLPCHGPVDTCACTCGYSQNQYVWNKEKHHGINKVGKIL